MMYRDHDGAGALVGLFFLLLFGGALAALVTGLVLLFRRGRGPGGSGGPAAGGWHQAYPVPHEFVPPVHPAAAAEQVLAERLARGEIDVSDYEQRLAALRRSHPAPPPPAPPAPPAGPHPGTPPTAP